MSSDISQLHPGCKGNQPTLHADIALLFDGRGTHDYSDVTPTDHGRIETRRIWCSPELSSYLDFPHVRQVFMIKREVFHKKSQKLTLETALGVTSRPPAQTDAHRLLTINRGHWVIENSCHYIID